MKQTKSQSGIAGDIKVDYVSNNYEMYTYMGGKQNNELMTFGSKIAISTGDQRKIPATSKMVKDSSMGCYFRSKLNQYVRVNCRTSWRSN
ncbi:hypothetical protein GC105_11255 [Alkalibaculum sp. M08DMB]|uniref:Uncharacterized protein n=1 Tax=Alkalibaculum sporogenes TaxID=2655001 RepID=A0A6A7KAJ3_9FIRM|nr:hypothetical protein [Alkalibaculum sporogenes]MPW26365.1 hypothetical protein [Alkalibaculum sporogenes]